MNIVLFELEQKGYSPRHEWSDDCKKVLVYTMPDLHAPFAAHIIHLNSKD